MAVGELARNQRALDLQAQVAESGAPLAQSKAKKSKPRQVVLYVHLSQAAITVAGTGGGVGLQLARVENHRHVLTAEQVKTWCANPDTEVVVKPVIDLADHIHVEAYESPSGSRSRPSSAATPACSRGAPDQHDGATTTT